MALFGSERDVRLFRHFNREVINDIVETYVDLLKLSIEATDTNLYGESDGGKYYSEPMRFACLINKDERTAEYDEKGYDTKQTIRFAILRDDLIDKNIFVEIGDVIHWNDIYWQIGHIVTNEYYANKNPETNKTIGDKWGWNVSTIAIGHMTDRRNVQIENTFVGNNKSEDYL